MKRGYLILLCLALLFSGGVFFYAYAALPGEGLTISPPINEPEIKPGETKTYIIKISNPTKKLVEATPQVMDFRAKGEGGEPEFYSAEEGSGQFALSKWISFEEPKIALAPEQVKEFKYKISVPTSAEPGGHYGAVFFATKPPEAQGQNSQVSLATMIGSLVLVKVPGRITEKAIVEEFKTDKKIYTKAPALLTTRITNLGNVHFKPRGTIQIKGWFGAPKDKITFNEQGGNVLPNSTRKFENKWQFSPFAFGYFKASENLIYGDSEKTLVATNSFWILPWWLIIVVIVLLVLLTLVVFWVRKRRKNKKKNLHSYNTNQSHPRPTDFLESKEPPTQKPPQGPILR